MNQGNFDLPISSTYKIVGGLRFRYGTLQSAKESGVPRTATTWPRPSASSPPASSDTPRGPGSRSRGARPQRTRYPRQPHQYSYWPEQAAPCWRIRSNLDRIRIRPSKTGDNEPGSIYGSE